MENVGKVAAGFLKDLAAALQVTNDWAVSLRLDTKECYCSILSVCAPQTEQQGKHGFLLTLEEVPQRKGREDNYYSMADNINRHVGS